MRRTKIVATLGPATDDPAVLESLLLAGANVVRLNFSHGTATDHRKRADQVRALAAKHDLSIAILADLQGPKIRVGKFADGKVLLKKGQPFLLDAQRTEPGNGDCCGIDYKDLPADCEPGDILLLNDGAIELEVQTVDGPRVSTVVRLGGVLSNHKGINKKGGGLSAPALTDKDRADILTAAGLNVDYVAVSFPKHAADMELARHLLKEAGSSARLVAKVERAEAIEAATLDKLILASDAVMVARGDLGVEIGDAELIGVQKHIIRRARHLNRLVIVATQMMESMITNLVPTRAEVFDVANAVLDSTDAVMLSAETASGANPIAVVEHMARICEGAEKHPDTRRSRHRNDDIFASTDESIAMAAMYTANHFPGIKAIIALTESGNTPLWMSRIRSALPIFALTRHAATRTRMALCRGVEALHFDPTQYPYDEVNAAALALLKDKGRVQTGDLVILSKGARMGVHGQTNAMIILQVP
jgi:pyruvate kinase